MKAREFSHERPLLDVSTCEHGHKLTITGVYEGDVFTDPNCTTARGTQKLHTATLKKYEVSQEWEADVKSYQAALERMRQARAAKKEAR